MGMRKRTTTVRLLFVALLVGASSSSAAAFVLPQSPFASLRPPCVASSVWDPRVLVVRQQWDWIGDAATTTTTTTTRMMVPSQVLQDKDVWIFVAGLIPFGWATVQFWRRIAVGEPFGTGRDRVYIASSTTGPVDDDDDDKNNNDAEPSVSRARRVLDRGAILTAYVLFGIAAAAIGLTLYSVLSSAPPPMELVPTTT